MNYKYRFLRTLMHMMSILPIQKTIVFCSYWGEYCNDNPKCIYDKIHEQHPEYKYVWLMRDSSTHIEGATVVKINSIRAMLYLSTSRVWVDNCRKRLWVVKRKQQYYMQTWHGTSPIKKIEKDAEEALSNRYVECAKNDSKMMDVLLVGSKYGYDILKKSFWFDGPILRIGQPRSDIFFNPNSGIKRNINRKFEIEEGTHILLYMPTFRVDENIDCYNIDFQLILEALRQKFGGKWVALIRLHPNIKNLHMQVTYSNHVLDASCYPSSDELIVASDVVITDYSSCMFDAMEAGKIVFLYASDISDYMNDRGFYLDIKQLPFGLCTSNEELSKKILGFDEWKYSSDVTSLKNTMEFYNDGGATQRAVDILVSVMQR